MDIISRLNFELSNFIFSIFYVNYFLLFNDYSPHNKPKKLFLHPIVMYEYK